MKLSIALGATVVLVAVMAAEEAHAISGIVRGCWIYEDERDEGNNSAGSLHLTTGTGVSRAIRRARVALLGGGGGEIGSGVTGADGCYAFNWNDPLALWFPTSGYKIRVELKDPSDFYITDTGGAQFVSQASVTLADSDHNVGTHGYPTRSGGVPNDEIQVFATAADYWTRIVDAAAVLSQRMTNIHIVATAPAGHNGCAGSCNWGANDVQIMDGDGENNPVFVVSHEIGHSTTLHAWGLSFPHWPVTCIAGHTYTSVETCEAFVFNEGSADFWAAAFSWSPDTAAPAFVMGPIETPAGVCTAGPTPWRIEGCIAAALWDVYDDPTADDDALDDSTNITLSGIVNIYDQFADNCLGLADRCSNEGGNHGPNHWDWMENFDDDFPTLTADLRDIYNACDINEGGEEPF